MVVEAGDANAVIWIKPDDWQSIPNPTRPAFFQSHTGTRGKGTGVGYADGSVRFLYETISPRVLCPLLTRNVGKLTARMTSSEGVRDEEKAKRRSRLSRSFALPKTWAAGTREGEAPSRAGEGDRGLSRKLSPSKQGRGREGEALSSRRRRSRSAGSSALKNRGRDSGGRGSRPSRAKVIAAQQEALASRKPGPPDSGRARLSSEPAKVIAAQQELRPSQNRGRRNLGGARSVRAGEGGSRLRAGLRPPKNWATGLVGEAVEPGQR